MRRLRGYWAKVIVEKLRSYDKVAKMVKKAFIVFAPQGRVDSSLRSHEFRDAGAVVPHTDRIEFPDL